MSEHDRDDNPLAGYDLSAWDAPPPPPGLADAVVERARARHSQTVTSGSMSWKKTLTVVGGIVAATAAAILFLVFGLERAPVDGRGDVQASVAQRLDLGTTSATIEPGGELGWRRRGSKIEVTQRRGVATWTVGANDTLVLESGDPGAMGASIEAAGASLRVEVRMVNRSDARALGIGSVVAAAVSVVTVVVYEGHVKSTHQGNTVTIAPGATAQFPAKVDPSPPDSQFGVGVGPLDVRAIKADTLAAVEGVLLAVNVTEQRDVRCDVQRRDQAARELHGKGDLAGAKAAWWEAWNCSQNRNLWPKLAIVGCATKDKNTAQFAVIGLVTENHTVVLDQIVAICENYGVEVDTTPVKTTKPDACDEVSCVLDNHEGTCCQTLKKARVMQEEVEAALRRLEEIKRTAPRED